jgi:hypothetical protein
MTFEEFFPHIRPWVANLGNVPPGSVVKPQFAVWEVAHILSLIMLGGATILMNLRLIGVGLTDESPSEVRRSLRPWLNLGVIGIVVTGVLIGSANAERLYDSNAFTVKMAALLAGIIFTYGVSGPVAKADGVVGLGPRIFTLLGFAVWLFGLWVFVTSQLINPGIFHVLTAAALIVLFAATGRLRWTYLVGLLVLIAVQSVATHIVIKPDDYTALTPVNKAFAWIFAVWILAAAAVAMFRPARPKAGGRLAQFIGYATILVWITAAAAGRWIAFA